VKRADDSVPFHAMMGMATRDLTVEDYGRLVALWEEAGLPHRPHGRDRRDRVARAIRESRSSYLAAMDGETLLGAVVATDDGRRGWINRLAVRPEVAAAEARLEARGIRIISCLIERDNDASPELFAALGYACWDGIVYHAKRLGPDA
jgi:hypothetical protein